MRERTSYQPVSHLHHTIQEYTLAMRKRTNPEWYPHPELPVWAVIDDKYQLTTYESVMHRVLDEHGEIDFYRNTSRVVVATDAGKPDIFYMGHRCV